jgi:hypothetical protein
MEGERKQLIENIIRLTYFMRGAIQYSDMMKMTPIEREMVQLFIEERLQTESKKMYAVY